MNMTHQAKTLVDPATRNSERRRHTRCETEQPVELQTSLGSRVAILLDISDSGARIRLPEGLSVFKNAPIALRLIDGTEIDGHVTWTTTNECGIEFEVYFLASDDLLHYDHLGSDYYARIIDLQRMNRQSKH